MQGERPDFWFALAAAFPAWSHFGMLIPSDSMVMQNDGRNVTLILSFSHPFELVGMELAKPKVFRVVTGGKTKDLLDSLQETQVMGHRAWQATYPLKRHGVYTYHMEPAPYWEPAEVEVEYFNEDKKYAAPAVYMITQTIKADKNGVFTYAAPVSGWWGFAALNSAEYKLPHNGEQKEVELGAVIWVYFHDMQ